MVEGQQDNGVTRKKRRPSWDSLKRQRDGHLEPTKVPSSKHGWLRPLHHEVGCDYDEAGNVTTVYTTFLDRDGKPKCGRP